MLPASGSGCILGMCGRLDLDHMALGGLVDSIMVEAVGADHQLGVGTCQFAVHVHELGWCSAYSYCCTQQGPTECRKVIG